MLHLEYKKINFVGTKDKVFNDANIIESKTAGSLFLVAEIEMKQEVAQKIFEIITAVLEREQQKITTALQAAEEINHEEHFEQLLNKVNNALATLASEGYTDWINKIHIAIASIKQDKFHLSCTGQTKVYLLRAGKLASIDKKIPTDNATPMKTFTSTIGGQLRYDDKIFITTPQLLENSSESEIQLSLEKNPIAQFIARLEQSLTNRPYSVSAVAISLTEEKDQPDDLKINFTAETAETVEAPAATSDTSLAEDASENKLEFPDLAGGEQSPEKIEPGSVKKTNSSKEKLSKVAKQAGQILGKSQEQIRRWRRNASTRSPQKRKSNISYQSMNKAPLSRSLAGNISGLAKRTSRGLMNKFYNLPRSSQVLAVAFLVMLLLFLGSILVISQKKKQINELGQNEILLEGALNKEKEASDALIYQDKEKAKKLLLEAKAEANELIKANILKEEAENLIVRIDDQLDRAEGITRVDDAILLAELENKTVNELIGLNGKIYVFDEKTNHIYSLDEANKQLLTVSGESNNLGHFKLATSNDDEGVIYLLTDTPALVEFDATTKILADLDIEIFNKEYAAKDLAQYGGKLYRLVPEAEQIYKHTGTIAGYSKGVEWVISDTDELENAQSITIDGFIYMLRADGTVNKYLRGAEQNFTLANLTSPMDNPTKIYTSENLTNLYIVDPGRERILAFNKNNGALTAQFKSNKFDELQDVFIDNDEKKMYVLADNKIYGIVIDVNESD